MAISHSFVYYLLIHQNHASSTYVFNGARETDCRECPQSLDRLGPASARKSQTLHSIISTFLNNVTIMRPNPRLRPMRVFIIFIYFYSFIFLTNIMHFEVMQSETVSTPPRQTKIKGIIILTDNRDRPNL